MPKIVVLARGRTIIFNVEPHVLKAFNIYSKLSVSAMAKGD